MACGDGANGLRGRERAFRDEDIYIEYGGERERDIEI